MDGNGRWAESRGLPRSIGHVAGARSLARVVDAAPALGVRVLTFYAFSRDNWRRPAREVSALMRLLQAELQRRARRYAARGARLTIIGRRDRLPAGLRRTIEWVETCTRGGKALHVRLAIDYSARETIARAAARLGNAPSERRLGELIVREGAESTAESAVDLLIRTGGERRLSDFLLWECAYAELCFTRRMWPDFGERDLAAAVDDFRTRTRRFGGLHWRA